LLETLQEFLAGVGILRPTPEQGDHVPSALTHAPPDEFPIKYMVLAYTRNVMVLADFPSFLNASGDDL
jgi:hypothetical protein